VNVEVPGSAVGNDSTDDTAALASAMSGVPASGILHLQPGKTSKISSALAWTCSIDGHGATIHQTNANADALVATDTNNLTLRNITIKGPVSGSPSGTGRGVACVRSSNPNVSRLVFENVLITSFGGNGLELSNPIVSSLTVVDVQFCGGHGFSIHGVNGGSAGTSVSLTACFAVSNIKAGYYVDTMTYCSFDGCAADQNGIGYELVQCNGISFDGCGAETQTDNSGTVAGYAAHSWKLNGGSGYTLSSCFTYDQHATSVWVTGSAKAVSLTGFIELNPNAVSTTCVQVDFGSDVVITNLRNVKPNSFNASAVVNFLPLAGVAPPDSGLLSWSYDPAFTSTGQLTVNGTLYLIKVPIRSLQPISTIWWNASAPGVTPTSGQNWAGIFNSSGTLVASVGVDAKVTSSNTPVSVTLGTSYTPTQPGFVWVALLFNAATPPTLLRTNGANLSTNNAGLAASAYRFATNGTGLTALPGSVTPSSNAAGPAIWVGVA
jgi:hypothetical protein